MFFRCCRKKPKELREELLEINQTMNEFRKIVAERGAKRIIYDAPETITGHAARRLPQLERLNNILKKMIAKESITRQDHDYISSLIKNPNVQNYNNITVKRNHKRVHERKSCHR